jgi:hypothetical protein
VILGDVSTALVLQGDPERANAVVHQAIDLVELTGSAAGKRRVFAAGRQLGPWRNEPFAQGAGSAVGPSLLMHQQDHSWC